MKELCGENLRFSNTSLQTELKVTVRSLRRSSTMSTRSAASWLVARDGGCEVRVSLWCNEIAPTELRKRREKDTYNAEASWVAGKSSFFSSSSNAVGGAHDLGVGLLKKVNLLVVVKGKLEVKFGGAGDLLILLGGGSVVAGGDRRLSDLLVLASAGL